MGTIKQVKHRASSHSSERVAAVTKKAALPGPRGDAHILQRKVGNGATARLLGKSDSLSRREATELAECIRIMGEESSDYCREVVLGEGPSTSGPQVPRIFRIVLEDLTSVRSGRSQVEGKVTQEFGPLAKRAGRDLEVRRQPPGDLLLSFTTLGGESRPCGGVMFMGNEGGGEIYVGAHRDLRVCGTTERRLDPSGQPTDEIAYADPLERVFDESEPEFGMFVGNTAVHELGHIAAKLSHTSAADNYMFAVKSVGANLPEARRTKKSMRLHWGGPKTFTPGQADLLVAAIQSNQFAGGMSVGPPSSPPVPTRPKGSLKPLETLGTERKGKKP